MKNSHWLVYVAALWFAVSGVYRIRNRSRQSIKIEDLHLRIQQALPTLGSSLGAGFLSIGMFRGARLFFVEETLTSINILAAVLLVLSAAEALMTWLFPVPIEWKWSALISSLVAPLLGVGVFLSALWLTSVPGNSANAIHLSYPIKGEWIVVTGGRSRITNYHHGRPESQNFAIDIIRRRGPSEGEPIYSPVDGIVEVEIGDRTEGSQEAEGNLVIIKKEDGTEIWLAHLQRGSVLAQKGDRVHSGQEIARCGSTGSADIAHLHIHAERNGAPIPMLFGKDRRFLSRNDLVEN